MKNSYGRKDGMTQVTVTLPEEMLEAIGDLAKSEYRSRNATIVMILQRYLDERRNPHTPHKAIIESVLETEKKRPAATRSKAAQ